MDDDEDDVLEPNWKTTIGEIRCEEKGDPTPCPGLARVNGMLPCGVSEEPRPLFYGNAGFRRHFPADFELDQEARRQPNPEEEEPRMEQLPAAPLEAGGVVASIGQKLQLIGDQFHREHLQQYHRNQRNHGLLWWRLATALIDLLFVDRGFFAGAARRR